jgi:hypothetical protein
VDETKNALFEWFWQSLTNDVCHRDMFTDIAFSHVFADFRGAVITRDALFQGATNGPLIESYLRFLGSLGSERLGYECSASYMLGGRALYMTALGPQIRESTDYRRIPVTYLLCVASGTNRWERGRLISLIHAAGTSRLAALRDLVGLRAAGNKLAALDHHAGIARAAVSQHRQMANPSPTAPNVTQCINNVHSHFNEITVTFNAAANADYGLLYRIERSRYYVARFEDNVSLMRISRVDGYHQYDEFVTQRLAGTFDFIDRLGRRYERAVSALSLLDSHHLSIQSNEIALSQQETEEEEINISDSIRKIQEYGEFILIAGLLPYYAVGLLAHIYEGVRTHEQIRLLTYVVWTLFFGFAIYRTKREAPPATRLSQSAVIAVATLIAVSVAAAALFWMADTLPPLLHSWLLSISHWAVRQFHGAQ